MSFELKSARYLAHDALSRHIKPGDYVIDATMGNGHDTCFLAELVGENGHVAAFDVQKEAVEHTSLLLAERNLLDRCSLFLAGHQHMSEFIRGGVNAVVFNLGWLPGGDKSVTTHWDTTRQAVEAGLDLLLPGGLMTVCVYPGHAAGEEERIQLTTFFSHLLPQEFNVLHQKFLNAGEGAPECFLLQKQLTMPASKKAAFPDANDAEQNEPNL